MLRRGLWAVAGVLVAGLAVWSAAAEPVPYASCGDGCKVCVPVCGTKKVPHTEYDCKCEDVCVPRVLPACLWDWCFGNHGAGCASCGKPRVVRKLVKFVEKREEPEHKCEVRRVGCCDGGCGAEVPAAPPAAKP